MWPEIIDCLEQAIKDNVAPAAVALAWRGREEFACCAGQADMDTVFDLASLTKPLATTPMLLSCSLSWSSTLRDIWGGEAPPDKRAVTLKQLLTHSAGMPAWRAYFKTLLPLPVAERPSALKSLILQEPLEYQPGSQALYSDLGYMLLGVMLEERRGDDLQTLYKQVQQAAGVENKLFYLPIGQKIPENIAGCGTMPELGRDIIKGQVEDENAFALNGVAAHAGLFGTAHGVKETLQKMFAWPVALRLWGQERLQSIFERDSAALGSHRTAGFDTPCGDDSSAGHNYPTGLIGHLGFTGVSFWYQPMSDVGVVVLTNRVAYGRDNRGIRELRPRLHNLLWPRLERLHA